MKKFAVKKMVKLYALLCEGTIAVAFGLMAPMLVGSIGLAMDVSQAYLVRQRLHGAIDAAALAAAATSQDYFVISNRVIDFITANYPPEEIGILNEDDIEVDITSSEVTVTATATYNTTFMRIFGYRQINVASSVVVVREIKGLEVVLVLDNTGSLDPNTDDGYYPQNNNPTNISAVRKAATSFVDILFDRVSDPEDIKIGIVPYSSSVNVGRYGLGQFPNGTTGYGSSFVTLPSGITYTTSHTSTNQTGSSWNGCITEHEATNYTASAAHMANTRGQMWSTATGANAGRCVASTTCRGHGWDPYITSNNPYNDDTLDNYRGPWDIYSYGKIIVNGTNPNRVNNCSGSSCNYQNLSSTTTCGSGYTCSNCYNGSITSPARNKQYTCVDQYCFCSYQRPNEYCPYATVLPLSSDETALKNVLREPTSSTSALMRAHGATYSNLGMAWGMRLISHDAPFTEGVSWGDDEWNKAIVLMTDGEMSPGGDLSAYWVNSKSTPSNSVANLNARLLEICTWLKAEPRNVIIYTITFDHATSDIDDTTKAIYRQCASEPKADHYFDAPTPARLRSTFERISGALANLHLKK